MQLSYHQKEIVTIGRKLAKLAPNSQRLINAREWWKAGCLSAYSNQDFDILQGLLRDLELAEKTDMKSWGGVILISHVV